MVNLILTGRAASNVFNDVIELDGGTVLRGVHERSQIGLMSLFEHYKSCQVRWGLDQVQLSSSSGDTPMGHFKFWVKGVELVLV